MACRCGISFCAECLHKLSLMGAGEPFADHFSQGGDTVAIPFQVLEVPDFKDGPINRPSAFIGPTHSAAPMPPAAALTHQMQVIDLATPNTEWGGGYANRQGTYLTIEPTLKPPLEFPRYDYAAMDTEKLLEEARQRVAMLPPIDEKFEL